MSLKGHGHAVAHAGAHAGAHEIARTGAHEIAHARANASIGSLHSKAVTGVLGCVQTGDLQGKGNLLAPDGN